MNDATRDLNGVNRDLNDSKNVRTTTPAMNLTKAFLTGGLALLSLSARARVVINEVYYHAPGDADGLEFIELHNAGSEAVRIEGWKFTKGVALTFPAGASIGPNGFVVVCRDRPALRKAFNADAVATFEQALKNGGERIELVNERGQVVDTVRFNNRSPWPVAPDGHGPSLERISPDAPSETPENWAASQFPATGAFATGTPGSSNRRYAANLPPVITNVTFDPSGVVTARPFEIRAEIQDPDGVSEAKLLYRLVGPGSEGSEQSLVMKGLGNHFTATVPPQKANQLVRYRIQATDGKGGKRTFPDEQDLQPTRALFVFDPAEVGKIGLGRIIHVDRNAMRSAENTGGGRRGAPELNEEDQARMAVWQQFKGGLDLESIWFHFAIEQQLSFDQLRKLQPVMARLRTDLESLIDSTVQAPDILQKTSTMPRLINDFQSKISAAIKGAVNADQFRRFTQESGKPGTAASNVEALLKQIVPLERTFFAASAQASVDQAQFQRLTAAAQAVLVTRSGMSNAVALAMKGQGDRTQLQGQIFELREKVNNDVAALLQPGQQEQFAAWLRDRPPTATPRSGAASEAARGGSAFVHVNPTNRQARVFDYITIRPRAAGFKVHLHDHEPLEGMTSVNLIFEYKDRFVLAEHLAYEFYRRAQCPAPASDYLRLNVNGRELGYHLLVEQPNRAFLERNKIETGGNLYKLLWYGQDVADKHEKKNNPETGHRDLVELINGLERTRGAAQWEFIRKHFNVEEVINYFAVNMCLTHWDGFFNNYFTYHDTKGTGKWEMYPWDQDKTWGFHDSLRDDGIFWDMPITFGMKGADVPGRAGNRSQLGFNPGNWWRPPGFFSGPLLANPEFRKHFLARTRQILDTVFTPEVFNPVVDELGARLQAEVAIRARVVGQNPASAGRDLTANLQLFKTQLGKRREFLLKEPEIQNAGAFSPAALK